MAAAKKEDIITKIITNFTPSLTNVRNGSVDSGLNRFSKTMGVNPFLHPKALSFMEQPRSIANGVVTDTIMAQRTHIETGRTPVSFVGSGLNDMTSAGIYTGTSSLTYTITLQNSATPDTFTWTDGTTTVTTVSITGAPQTLSNGVTIKFNATTGHTVGNSWSFTINPNSNTTYVYAIGSTGRFYKIQSNNPNTSTADYDNPVLLTTLGSNSPTFNYGSSITFYAGYIFIGHDVGVTRINYDGTGETFLGSVASWVQNVPRPAQSFIGNVYFGNGNNLAELTSGLIITTYTKINPGIPIEYQIQDLAVTVDGNYLVAVSPRLNQSSIDVSAPFVNVVGTTDSIIEYWNGADVAFTSFSSFPSFNQNGYITFGQNEYLFGSDNFSAILSTPTKKLLSLPKNQPPMQNAIQSNSNLALWMTPEYNDTALLASLHCYGDFDVDFQSGHYRLLSWPSTLAGGDIMRVPSAQLISNISYGGANSGYTNNIIGTSKMYFSTYEYNGSTTATNFYAFAMYPIGLGTACTGTAAVWESQEELLGKKYKPTEVRVYLENAKTNQSFQVDLIGIDGNVLTDSNGAKQFSVSSGTMVVGDTLVWYNPQTIPTAAIGIRVTNLGTVTPIIRKIELDLTPQGK